MKRITIALAALAAVGMALPATSFGWDELPCGETEETAHVCAPGEVARDGTIPNPLPQPTPAPVPNTPEQQPSNASSVVVTPPPVAKPPPGRTSPQRQPCRLFGRLTLYVPNHTLTDVLGGPPFYTGRVTLKNTGAPIRFAHLNLRFPDRPALAYFERNNGERSGQSIGFPIRNLAPQKTYSKTFRFQHPVRAFLRFYRTVASVTDQCGHTTTVGVRRFEVKRREG
jgi:hypothetical protein